jgi:ABC-2 type transport system permease protein
VVFASPAGFPIAVAGSLLMLTHLIIATQAFSATVTLILRSRRGRDLAFLIIGVVGFGGYGLQRAIANTIGEYGLEGAVVERALSSISWLIPPVSAQHAVVASAAGDFGRALLALAVAAGWVAVLGRLWFLAVRRLVTVPEAPMKDGKSRTWILAKPFGWSTVGMIASKELRFYWRDPRMRMVWTGGAVFLGVLAASIAFGSTQLAALEGSAEFTLSAPAVVLFIGLPIALNQFGWERTAASYMFALPVKASQLLLGKNVATAITLAVEAVALALIFAAFTNGWSYLVYIPPLVATAILCQLAIGNLVSVITPLRLPPPKGDLFSQASEQGCLALISQLLAFGVIGLLLVPPATAFTLITLFGVRALKWQLIFSIGSVLWGVIFYVAGTFLASRRLTRRLPEMVTAVQTT